MNYDAIADHSGESGICIRATVLDQGVLITAVDPRYVVITSLRNGTRCQLPASAYLALAEAADELHKAASARPHRPVHHVQRIMVCLQPDGYLEVKIAGDRRGVKLTDPEFLSLADNPRHVITKSYELGMALAHFG